MCGLWYLRTFGPLKAPGCRIGLSGVSGCRDQTTLYPWILVSLEPGNLGFLYVWTLVPLKLWTLESSGFPGRAVGSVGMSEPTLNN